MAPDLTEPQIKNIVGILAGVIAPLAIRKRKSLLGRVLI